MKISEIIERLEDIRAEHGDLECLDGRGYGIWGVSYQEEFNGEWTHEDEHCAIEND